jgi:hypothetical protein
MKTIIKPNHLIFFLVAAISLCALQAFAEKSVTVKGMSFFEPGREMIAREKALDQAKRAAIEKAIGTLVESKSAVENFQLVREQILTRSSGYLKNIKIVSEQKTDLGTYEVVIQADVEYSAITSDFDRFDKLLSWQKNPRCSIIIEPGIDKSYLPTALKAANLLTEKLKSGGLKVFKHTANNEMRVGFLVGLILNMSATKSSYQNMQITLNEVSLSANIYRSGNDEILATSSAVKSLPGENRLQILDKGVTYCVDSIWKDLRKQLINLWEKELYNERDITLVVNNLPSLARAQDIAATFESDVSGVVSANLIHFKGNSAEYSLKYRGWPEHLWNEFQMSYFENKYFESDLQSIKGNELIINIK